MQQETAKRFIEDGNAVLGLELGSTRIKAVLIGEDCTPLASGSHAWENQLVNGVWTYSLDDVWAGVQASYRSLCNDVLQRYGTPLRRLRAMGCSAMMHGYLAFDANGAQLAPFATWRNTLTEQAAIELTALLGFNIPQRWSIAHLYQAVLEGKPHTADIDYLTTLSGYVHWKLTGQRVLGIGDASGMFPIDSALRDFDEAMLRTLQSKLQAYAIPWQLRDILPRVLCAGADAGMLTPAGALLLDPSGALEPGVPLCPPEGDAGTGMVATNSIAPRTGNVSAGTSIFAMVVLEKPLSRVYPELDLVTTPSGDAVAMVHANNCSSDIDAWAQLLCQFAAAIGAPCTMPQALDAIFYEALSGDADCGGTISYNYFAGETITGLDAGRPLLVRLPDAKFTFANFARAQLNAALATLKLGMDLLTEREHVKIDSLLGHGGFFKAAGVGQRLMAAALGTPVSVMATAGEGGPWGMALLAAYRADGAPDSLQDYLAARAFASAKAECVRPNAEDVAGFARYLARFEAALPAERAAAEHFI